MLFSGKLCPPLLLQIPGLGSGICDFDMGSQLELESAWFLKGPSSKAFVMSLNLNAHIALPAKNRINQYWFLLALMHFIKIWFQI